MDPEILFLHDVGQSTRYSYTDEVSSKEYIRINEGAP